jgi:signal transduction histidine kinase
MFLAARADRWACEHPLRLDIVLAGLAWLVLGPASALVRGGAGLAMATLTIGALVFRRRFPVAVLCWSAVAFAVQLLLIPIPLPANAAQAIVVYTVAAHVTSPGARLSALAAAVAGCLTGGFRWSTPPQYTRNALLIGVTLAFCSVLIWVIGELVRGGRANTRALHEARIRLEQSRLREERLAAQRRRTVAAAEIHDIVAHSLTVVIVQADAGGYAAGHAPSWQRAEAGAALATIAGTARTALAEVRGVIEMLHQPEPGQDPAVGRDEVRRLVGAVRAAGLPVRGGDLPGWFDEVPPEVRLAVFRAVREALTNVLKHAGAGTTAWLTVERRDGAVRVRVEDDGPGRPATAAGLPSGHGLNGLRERLRAVDGVLTAGPRPGHGFLLEVPVPLDRR